MKYILVIIIIFTRFNSFASCSLDVEEKYDAATTYYKSLNCQFSGIKYNITLGELYLNTDISTNNNKISISSWSNPLIERGIIINKEQATLEKVYMNGFNKFDRDGQYTKCKLETNTPLQKKNDFDYLFETFSLDREAQNCRNTYTVIRSFDQVYNYFIPSSENKDSEYQHFDYEYAAEINSYKELSDPARYVAYLKKYPMTPERVERYYQMGNILNQVKLYNESNLLLANVIANYPNFVTSYLIMGDNYWGLEAKKEAKENYQRYLDNQTDKSKIPERVKLRLKAKQ